MTERTLTKDLQTQIGASVILKGWAETLREMGKITFVDLRDRSGKVQCVAFSPEISEKNKGMRDITVESVIEITGEVKKRPEKMINKDQPNGNIEIEVKDYKILNKAKALPIPVNGEGYDINEDARLKYRYLDLRRERLQRNIRLRSKYINLLRSFFLQRDFVEIETPMLTKATMEGARDFLVPSRINPGKFYALPQSPQQYKQLLMTAGFERYFQLARCIRDENLRADRGFEFAQIDLEMSFVEREDVMKIVEESIVTCVPEMGGILRDTKFPVFTYQEAMEKYGADKFDIRNDEEKQKGVLAFAWVIDFPFFKKVDKEDAAEVKDGKSGWTFTHNPFSMPVPEHVEDHLNGRNVDQILTTQYDLVCNGLEVAGGSIRAHNPEILKSTYKIMGYTDEEIEKRVGHMIEAFSVGTPPHGGIAYGIDRQVALLSGEDSIKETFAFPMSYTGKTSVMDAPSSVDNLTLKELNLLK